MPLVWKVNHMYESASSVNNCGAKMDIESFDCEEDDEHGGVGFVVTFSIFVIQNEFFIANLRR